MRRSAKVVYNMINPKIEGFLLENCIVEKFVGLNCIALPPDETTILIMRLLEEQDFGMEILKWYRHFGQIEWKEF